MKITGGKAKGIPIKVPNNSIVRPATDYLRQAIFSSLGDVVIGSKFLDLFAGTGAYGLEAWSRGATGGLFIEKDRNCLSSIQLNLQAVAKSIQKNPLNCKIIQADVFKNPLIPESQFDLIFADPPYEISKVILPELLNLTIQYLSKKSTSRLVIEVPGHLNPAEHTDLVFLKKLGKDTKNSPTAFIWQFK